MNWQMLSKYRMGNVFFIVLNVCLTFFPYIKFEHVFLNVNLQMG